MNIRVKRMPANIYYISLIGNSPPECSDRLVFVYEEEGLETFIGLGVVRSKGRGGKSTN